MTSSAVLLGEATVALVAEQHVGELMPRAGAAEGVAGSD